VVVSDAAGENHRYDRLVLATHADQALRLLENPTREERNLLGSFQYLPNDAVLHTDRRAMPRRRAAWASWNYLARRQPDAHALSVTYWMNSLQDLSGREPVFLSLNPFVDVPDSRVLRRMRFEHPHFTSDAISAQKRLWSLQGVGDIWYCGAYFGFGFHEDGLQAGLAVAEEIGGVRRPWTVSGESARIHLSPQREAVSQFATTP
jgi:predicted NAD/FAD-binding protein